MSYAVPHHNPERINKPKGWKGMYRDPQRKLRVAGYSNTHNKAVKLAEDKEAEIRRGEWVDSAASKMTFSEYFEKHWFPHQAVAKNTLIRYQTHYDSALKEAFGHLQLCQITKPIVARWVATQLRDSGNAPRTVGAKRQTLHTVLGRESGISAVQDGAIKVNPAKGVKVKPGKKRKVDIYQYPEFVALMEKVDPWWQTLVLLAAESGLRWGELMGLRVMSFSNDFQMIEADTNLIEVGKKWTDNGTPYEEKPSLKGDEDRFIAIRPLVAEAVRTLVRERQLFPQDRLFSMPGKDGLPRRTKEWPTGLPMARSVFRQHHWIPAHEASGVRLKRTDGRNRRFHDLRGSHITWLLMGGARPQVVQQRVGHKKYATTEVYVGALEDNNALALSALDLVQQRYGVDAQ